MTKTPKTKQKYHVKKGFVIDFYLIPLKEITQKQKLSKTNTKNKKFNKNKKQKTNNYNHYRQKA